MRKLTLVLTFLPAMVPTLAFFGIWIENAQNGVRNPYQYSLFLLAFGAMLLVLGLVAWRAPVIGGFLLIVHGAGMALFLGSLALSRGMDPVLFLVAALPFYALVILAGALNMRLGFKLDEPGQGRR